MSEDESLSMLDPDAIKEILRYGETMTRVLPDGTTEYVPREQWLVDHKD